MRYKLMNHGVMGILICDVSSTGNDGEVDHSPSAYLPLLRLKTVYLESQQQL